MLALQELAPSLRMEPGDQPDELSIIYTFRAGKRKTKTRLRLDAEYGRVFAKEYNGVKGDAPITKSEARMRFMSRRPGEMVHPAAGVVYSSDWNVTVPTKAKWRPLDDSLQLPPPTIAHFAANLPYFLPEIVHQSGWQWKGVFLF